MNEKIQNKKWFIFLQFKIIFNNRIIIFNIFQNNIVKYERSEIKDIIILLNFEKNKFNCLNLFYA